MYDANQNSNNTNGDDGNSNINKNIVTRVCNNKNSENHYNKGFQN